MTNSVLPNQLDERTDSWWEKTVDHYLSRASSFDYRQEMIELYQLASGALITKNYNYVINPYGDSDKLKNYIGDDSTKNKFNKFPSRLRNYDIISPIINVYLGELAKRPFNYTVMAVNEEVSNEYLDQLMEYISSKLEDSFIYNLNKNGANTGIDVEENPNIPQEVKNFSESYASQRSATGQVALDYLWYNLSLKDQYQKLALDFFAVGHMVTFKDVYRNDVDYQIVSPLDVRVVGLPSSGFIEDAEAVVRDMYLTSNQIVSMFRSDLTEEQIQEILKGNLDQDFSDSTYNNGQIITGLDNLYVENKDKHLVYHVQWNSLRKIYVLEYIDEFGERAEIEVTKDYELSPENGDIEIKTEIINDTLEAYKISKNILVRKRPLVAQRSGLTNISVQKLGYNGYINMTRTGEIVSPTKTLRPYQELYNILHYRYEFMLAKSKDKITFLPIDIVPDKYGVPGFLYYLDVMSIGFINGKDNKALQYLQYMKSIDLSITDQVLRMYEHIQSIRLEAWNAVGMNPQRYGNISNDAGKGVTNQAVFRSSVITAELFRKINKFQESDLRGLLDYSKIAWIDGKKGYYLNSSKRVALLEIDGLLHCETDYGVFITDQSEELEKIEFLKSMAQPLAQNGLTADVIAEIIDTNNFNKIKLLIKESVEKQNEINRELEEMRNNAALQKEQMISEDKAADREQKYYSVDKDFEKSIEVALINAAKSQNDLIKANLDNLNEQVKMGLERMQIQVDERNNIRDNQTRRDIAKQSKAK